MDADIPIIDLIDVAEPVAEPVAPVAPVVFIDLTLPEDPEVVQERKRARRAESSLQRRTNEMLASTAVQNAILDDFTRNPKIEEIEEQTLNLETLLVRVQCVACQKRYKTTVLLPCRHMATCFECTVAIRTRNSRCPMCNKEFDRHLNVFY
jgi:hypothetical protein